MPKIKVTLSIGFPSASRNDILDIPDDEYNDCETDEERESFLGQYWQDWANNYIESGFELIE